MTQIQLLPGEYAPQAVFDPFSAAWALYSMAANEKAGFETPNSIQEMFLSTFLTERFLQMAATLYTIDARTFTDFVKAREFLGKEDELLLQAFMENRYAIVCKATRQVSWIQTIHHDSEFLTLEGDGLMITNTMPPAVLIENSSNYAWMVRKSSVQSLADLTQPAEQIEHVANVTSNLFAELSYGLTTVDQVSIQLTPPQVVEPDIKFLHGLRIRSASLYAAAQKSRFTLNEAGIFTQGVTILSVHK